MTTLLRFLLFLLLICPAAALAAGPTAVATGLMDADRRETTFATFMSLPTDQKETVGMLLFDRLAAPATSAPAEEALLRLEKFAVPAAVRVLGTPVSDANQNKILKALDIAPRLGPDAAATFAGITNLLSSRREPVSDAASRALQAMAPGSLPWLIRSLDSSGDRVLQMNAIRTLIALGPKAGAALPALIATYKTAETGDVPGRSASVKETLQKALQDGTFGTAPASAVEDVVPFLQDTDPEIRATAMGALASTEAAKAVPALAYSIRNDTVELRARCEQTLEAINTMEARAVLDEYRKVDPQVVKLENAVVSTGLKLQDLQKKHAKMQNDLIYLTAPDEMDAMNNDIERFERTQLKPADDDFVRAIHAYLQLRDSTGLRRLATRHHFLDLLPNK